METFGRGLYPASNDCRKKKEQDGRGGGEEEEKKTTNLICNLVLHFLEHSRQASSVSTAWRTFLVHKHSKNISSAAISSKQQFGIFIVGYEYCFIKWKTKEIFYDCLVCIFNSFVLLTYLYVASAAAFLISTFAHWTKSAIISLWMNIFQIPFGLTDSKRNIGSFMISCCGVLTDFCGSVSEYLKRFLP